MRAFKSRPESTVNIDVSSSSQRVAISAVRDEQIRVMNNGTATVWVTFGDSTVTATVTSGEPFGPGVTEIATAPNLAIGTSLYAAAIAAGSTGKIYFTPGMGI